MKLQTLFERAYVNDALNTVKDLLVSLKIKGVEKIKTSQLEKELAGLNIQMSEEEIIDLVSHLPFVDNANKYEISFSEEGDSEFSSDSKKELDKEYITRSAQKLAKKNLREK